MQKYRVCGLRDYTYEEERINFSWWAKNFIFLVHPVSFNWYNISSKVGTVVFRNAWISVHFFFFVEAKRDRVALPGMACGWSLCYLIESLIFGVDGEQRDSRGENHIWNPDSRWSGAWFLLMKVFTVERLRRQYMKACACFYFLTWFYILC